MWKPQFDEMPLPTHQNGWNENADTPRGPREAELVGLPHTAVWSATLEKNLAVSEKVKQELTILPGHFPPVYLPKKNENT